MNSLGGGEERQDVLRLVMALSPLGLWVRSHIFCDRFSIGHITVVSQCREFSVGWKSWHSIVKFNTFSVGATVPHHDVNGKFIEYQPMRWPHYGAIVSHWVLAVALTLLAAYLILWKPRKQEGESDV